MARRRRVSRAGTILVLLASGLTLGGPVQGGGVGAGPYMSASSSGDAGCSGNPPLGPTDCREWDKTLATGEASTWHLAEEVGLTVAGGAMAATATADAVELDNADGTLGSLTLTATMEATLTGGGVGEARVEFTANFPVSSDSISVIGTASVEGHGTAIIGGSGDINVTVGCAEEPALDRQIHALGGAHGGEVGRLDDDAKSESLNATIVAEPTSNGSRFCSLRVFMDASANTNRANPGSEFGSGKATLSLTILAGGAATPSATPDPADCALSGTVHDGDAVIDGHDNPLVGIRVELLRNSTVVGSPVATKLDGRYCIPWSDVPQAGPRSPEPGSYELRATLVDAEHEPPVFQTEHEDIQEPISALFDVAEADWGVPEVELDFTKTDAKPWLSDVAHIHWQSARFVDWILDVLQVPPADLSGLRVRAYDAGGTRYSVGDKVAHITVDDSQFDDRTTALSDAPENDEWHEIAHHLGPILGIAPSSTAVACQGREPHGGWTNTTTCDSLTEAFAMFVSVYASLELDAGRDGGYATSHYAGFGDSDDNNYPPWSFTVQANGNKVYREDLGVLRLLWDLQDDTPAEASFIVATPRSGGGVAAHALHDRVALGGANLIHLLADANPETVADIYTLLTTSQLVDPGLRAPDIDLDGDGSADISAIDEVFLMHEIRPLGAGPYKVGNQIGHTPPGSAGLADRRHVDPLPGAVVRLVNTGTGLATFTIAITSESGTGTFLIPVRPGSTLDLPVSLGPYWTQALPADAELPPCGAEGERVITLAVSGPGAASQSVGGCDYAHRVVAAVDGVALTLQAAGSEPVPSAAPGASPGSASPAVEPIILILGLVAVGLVVVGGVLVFARRRQ